MELALPIERDYVPVTTESSDRPFRSRDVYFKKTDFTTYGYHPGCPGCDSIRLGGPTRNHNAACRARMFS
eukprot:11883569-Karenia_brevis.AAC.1